MDTHKDKKDAVDGKKTLNVKHVERKCALNVDLPAIKEEHAKSSKMMNYKNISSKIM